MDKEERGYIFLAHLFAAIPLWGILFNGIMWISFKERSRKVVFHAHQGIFVQVIFLAAVLAGLLAFLFTEIIAVINAPIASLLQFGNHVILILLFVSYELCCLYAMWNILQDREYEYPFIGARLREDDQEESISLGHHEDDVH